LIVVELGWNPIVDEDKSFDIYPESVYVFSLLLSNARPLF
jgi:hypothetical protein